MLTEEEAVACFDYIVNCRKAYTAICTHFVDPRKYKLIPLIKLAVHHAKADWDSNFLGKEPQPTWRRHDASTYYEQLVDLIIEHKDQFA